MGRRGKLVQALQVTGGFMHLFIFRNLGVLAAKCET